MREAKPSVGSDTGDIDIEEIFRRLPHRPPFLLIDRAEDFRAGKSLVGVKCVTMNEPFFAGHFPGHPVMPGVLIIEALAQTGGLLMAKTWGVDFEQADKIILFVSVDKCRFRSPVRPGDVLKLHADLMRERGDVAKFRGQARVEGKVVADVEFTAMLADAPK